VLLRWIRSGIFKQKLISIVNGIPVATLAPATGTLSFVHQMLLTGEVFCPFPVVAQQGGAT
jgi:hypothetical protein